MTQKQLPAGPQVQAITVQDGDMRVTVSAEDIIVAKIGPQGGVAKSPVKYTASEIKRLISLLELAHKHQQLFAASVRGE